MKKQAIDIYFDVEWQKIYAKRENLDLQVYNYSSEYGEVRYVFGKRKIVIDGKEWPYYDIVTPYAFSGPLLMPAEDTEECSQKLADAYEEAFESYCLENNIVAEFIQFNPWVHNSKYLEKYYDMDFRSEIVGTDLTVDFWMEEFHSNVRRNVKKAERAGVEIVYDYEGKYIDEFLRIYDFTIDKYQASKYYQFTKEEIEHMFKVLPGKVFLALAKYEGRFVNSILYLKGDEHVHVFIAGNDPSVGTLNANTLIIYDTCLKMKDQGIKYLIQGGGDGKLISFKKKFTRNSIFSYYSGKKIHNKEKYDEFTKLNGVLDTKFFPAYRDNGKVKYKHWEDNDKKTLSKEIGGYIELDQYRLPMLHEGAVALNCGRNAVQYLIEAKNIKHICMPIYMCESVKNLIRKVGIELSFYHIGEDFCPVDAPVDENIWIYLVNFYGQLTGETLEQYAAKYPHVIIDNCHAYFTEPLPGYDVLYSCRKNLGVADGAFLYTDTTLQRPLLQEESFTRMNYLLGRFERNASEFYKESADNNEFFIEEPLMKMSKLTDNLLRGIDYEYVKRRRTENFAYLCEAFKDINLLNIKPAEGGFMFPLMIKDAQKIRKELAKKKIYIPLLWPNVLEDAEEGSVDYRLSWDVLPLPCDQRYDRSDMDIIISAILGDSPQSST